MPVAATICNVIVLPDTGAVIVAVPNEVPTIVHASDTIVPPLV